ncbi:MAG: S8 family peptidase [Bacteroidota bacterium]
MVLGSANLRWKLTPTLQQQLHSNAFSFRTIVVGRKGSLLKEFLLKQGIPIAYHNRASNTFVVTTTKEQIENILLTSPEVIYLDIARSGIAEESKVRGLDLSVNRINILKDRQPTLAGSGQIIQVKEGMFQVEDLDIRGRVVRTTREARVNTNHATDMATIIAGGANSSLEGEGVAPKAEVAGTNAPIEVFPEPISYFDSLGSYIQNNSYGLDINNAYSSESATFDALVASKPEVLIVFSSGNEGWKSDTIGKYANLDGFANLTGNFKQAKNHLVVGGADTVYNVPVIASRGPAYDGRIKPEVVAHSPGGTSDAAATVSGIAALLHETFLTREGNLPPASLMRATLANTADDIALTGPDYFSGYGNVNAYRAWESIYEQSYYLDTVALSETLDFSIDVTEGAREIRVALAWTDPAANPGDFKALVHDLNLTLTTPSSEVFLPWVLNSDPSQLNQPAIRGTDVLNNLEQVTLTNPETGTYTASVSCSNCSVAQSMVLHYWVDEEPVISFTHPTKTDPWLVSEKYFVRWNAAPEATQGILQKSSNNQPWETLDSDLNLQREFFSYLAPSTPETIQFRLIYKQDTLYSDLTRVHPNIRPTIGLACGDSILLQWPADPAAESYTLHRFGNTTFEPWVTLPDTAFFISVTEDNGFYFSVEPNINSPEYDNHRALAIDYRLQGGQCYFQYSLPLLDEQTETVDLQVVMASILNLDRIEAFRIIDGQATLIGVEKNPTTSEFSFVDTDLPEGVIRYVLTAVTDYGATIVSDTSQVYYVAPNKVTLIPNPTAAIDGFQLYNNFDSTVTLEFLSVQGQIVREYILDDYSEYIDTYGLRPGIYHYIIRTREEIFSGKVLLQ